MDAPSFGHRGGTPWCDCPVPPRKHTCTAQSYGYIAHDFIQRCACGAYSRNYEPWLIRNSRADFPFLLAPTNPEVFAKPRRRRWWRRRT